MSELDEEDSRSFVVDEDELVDQDELVDEDEQEDESKRRIISGLVGIIQRRYALTNVTYMSPCFGGSDRTVQVLATTYSNEWVRHYKAQEYSAVDPVILAAAQSALPVDMGTLAWKKKKARRLFDEAQAAGIGEQGLVIPLRGPVNGIWGLLSVTSDVTAPEWEKRREELSRELLFVGHHVHHFVFMLYGEPSSEISIGTLGVRETNALQQLADGATFEEIASVMRVTIGTVKQYLVSARAKLHADNSSHAIAYALRAGLIH